MRDLADACDSGNIKVATTLLARLRCPRCTRRPHPALNRCFPRLPLWLASSMGHVAIVKVLLDANAKVDAVQGCTSRSLHIACGNGHAHVVATLLNANAAVNEEDPRDGFSALYFACAEGHTEIVVKLLDAKADVDQDGVGGEEVTPLYIACQNGHTKVVAKLLDAGAKAKNALPAVNEALDDAATLISSISARGAKRKRADGHRSAYRGHVARKAALPPPPQGCRRPDEAAPLGLAPRGRRLTR